MTALDYARRKLARLQANPPKHRKSASLDENDQLQLPAWEQEGLDKLRNQLPEKDRAEYMRMYWKERLRAARRVFNDPAEVEKIVELLEAAGERPGSS